MEEQNIHPKNEEHKELNFDARIPLEALKTSVEDLKSQLSKIIVGQTDFVELLIVGLLSNGHVLIEGRLKSHSSLLLQL